MSDAQPQAAGPGAVPAPGMAPTASTPPVVQGTPALGSAMVADQLAIDIGRAVIAVLQRSAKDGRLPPELAQLASRSGQERLFSALERNPAEPHQPPTADPSGDLPALAPASASNRPCAARPMKKQPGTVTIRAAVRRAQELALAPPGSDLAHLRLALIAVLITVVSVAVAVTYVLSFVKW